MLKIASKAAIAALLLPFAAGMAVAQSAPTDPSSKTEGKTAPAPDAAAGVDTNADGKPDAWDRDANGTADAWDTNADGKPDTFDADGDGKPDSAAPAKR